MCKQTTIKPGTSLKEPLIDIYLKNDELNDPLLTKDRIKLLNIISNEDLELIEKFTLSINLILKDFFLNINLDLIDFKLEFGKNNHGEIVLADEFSPDNCRLWDLNAVNVKMRSLDKDRFRNDLGGLIEAYTEINNRIDNFLNSKSLLNYLIKDKMKNQTLNLKNFVSGIGYILLFLFFSGSESKADTLSPSPKKYIVSNRIKWVKIEENTKSKEIETVNKELKKPNFVLIAKAKKEKIIDNNEDQAVKKLSKELNDELIAKAKKETIIETRRSSCKETT